MTAAPARARGPAWAPEGRPPGPARGCVGLGAELGMEQHRQRCAARLLVLYFGIEAKSQRYQFGCCHHRQEFPSC